MKRLILNKYVFDLLLLSTIIVGIYLWYSSTAVITEADAGRVLDNEVLSIKTLIEDGTKKDIIVRKLYME